LRILAGLYTQGLRRLKFSRIMRAHRRASVLGLPSAPSHNSVSKLSQRFKVKELDKLTEAQMDYMTQRIMSMQRTGKPEEIAAAVHLLSSPDCSFVTAQCHGRSGGWATYRADLTIPPRRTGPLWAG
jgi:hypothetical protein